MKKAIISISFIFLCLQLFAQFSLKVSDPQRSWYSHTGTIEEARLEVKPKGLFMEYGLYLTFSSRNSQWNDVYDTVEVVMNFSLPEDAVVIDSWLWVGDEIVKADLLDKWTASLIYESIVNRRKDPSILTKQSATDYELRVFPMAGNETRKVKLTYLMPTRWSKDYVSADLPMRILHSSTEIPELQLLALCDTTWSEPVITNYEGVNFEQVADSISADYREAEVHTEIGPDAQVAFPTPVNEGLYLSCYKDGTEGIYQLALFPSFLLDTLSSKKVMVLVDYDISNTHLSIDNLMQMIKNQMLNSLSERDSFNLVFSSLPVELYNEQWVAATDQNIEAAFDRPLDQISNYSNLASLLAEGIEFINDHSGDGKIVLISDSDQYNEFEIANTLINDILRLMDQRIAIHISDYQTSNIPYFYHNGLRYSGNDYFYLNLSKLTLGSFHSAHQGITSSEVIRKSFTHVGGSINSFDLHTSMANGFCHGRYGIQGEGNFVYIDNAMMQVGKFNGEFPFQVEMSGEYNDMVFSKNFIIEEANVYPVDTIAQEIWTGQYIQELESMNSSNDVISEIIYYSLAERILSRYTSFLCLEPGMEIVIDEDDGEDDDWISIAVEEDELAGDSLLVYPNPFTEFVNIELSLSDPEEAFELSVFDLAGSLIYRFEQEQVMFDNKYVFTWNGTSGNGLGINPGMYLLVCKTRNGVKTIKLVKQ